MLAHAFLCGVAVLCEVGVGCYVYWGNLHWSIVR